MSLFGKRFFRTVTAILTVAFIAAAFPAAAFAGEWRWDQKGWWFRNDDGSWPSNGWQYIGGKYYYFNESGYMLENTTTPDGYRVGPDGAWIQSSEKTSTGLKSLQGTFIRYNDYGWTEDRYISGNTLSGNYMNRDGQWRIMPTYTVTWNGDGTGTAESDSSSRTLQLTIISRNAINIDGELFNRVMFRGQ